MFNEYLKKIRFYEHFFDNFPINLNKELIIFLFSTLAIPFLSQIFYLLVSPIILQNMFPLFVIIYVSHYIMIATLFSHILLLFYFHYHIPLIVPAEYYIENAVNEQQSWTDSLLEPPNETLKRKCQAWSFSSPTKQRSTAISLKTSSSKSSFPVPSPPPVQLRLQILVSPNFKPKFHHQTPRPLPDLQRAINRPHKAVIPRQARCHSNCQNKLEKNDRVNLQLPAVCEGSGFLRLVGCCNGLVCVILCASGSVVESA